MLTILGIHPLAAVSVIAVDLMLFGGTVSTGGMGWAVSVPVGIALAIAVSLVQRRGSPLDDLGLAVGKGLIVGVLTAIPTPLPSVLVAGAGTTGAISMFRNNRRKGFSGGSRADRAALRRELQLRRYLWLVAGIAGGLAGAVLVWHLTR